MSYAHIPSVTPGQPTLDEAKAWLRQQLKVGADCPCCTQFTKIYRRQITGSAIAALIKFHRHAGLDYAHAPSVVGGRVGGEFARMAYWGLIEEDATHKGTWRVTQLGRDFVRGNLTVPKFAHVYDGRLLKFSGSPVSAEDCCGKKFVFKELMAA